MQKKVYLLPGLGADRRMYLSQLDVLERPVVLEHLPVETTNSLADYAGRLVPLIDGNEPFILVGASLGGMVAQELCQIVKPEKLVLLSTVKSRDEMPFFIRSMKQLKLHRLLRGKDFIRFNNLLAARLDSRGDSPVAELIIQMAKDTDPRFIEWAINAVINWQPPVSLPVAPVHIHGTKDALFPYSRISNAIAVEGGSHVMNMTKSNEVNRLLLEAIK